MHLAEFFCGAANTTPPLRTHHPTHRLAGCEVCATLPAVAASQAGTPRPFSLN
ncbi:MAG: hypothetical protein ACK514_16685 [Bacteroidota bacterium]|nr:hypothetical protein [Cytophagales bacterium]MCE2958664.1 hypothetical protein [Flammeovirgaceae bacterium]MCZ8072089.1 hypothetical protein [Cytophagales bacterium]